MPHRLGCLVLHLWSLLASLPAHGMVSECDQPRQCWGLNTHQKHKYNHLKGMMMVLQSWRGVQYQCKCKGVQLHPHHTTCSGYQLKNGISFSGRWHGKDQNFGPQKGYLEGDVAVGQFFVDEVKHKHTSTWTWRSLVLENNRKYDFGGTQLWPIYSFITHT